MKKSYIVFLFFLLSVLVFGKIYYYNDGSFPVAIKTMYFGTGEENILRFYIKVPLYKLKMSKDTIQKGKTIYNVKNKFNIVVTDSKGTILGKDKWKAVSKFNTVNSRLYVLEYYDVMVPRSKKYNVKLDVTDLNSKKCVNIEFSEIAKNFDNFAISSFFWATEIRQAKPDDPKYLQFNSLYFKPIIDDIFYSPDCPMCYFEIYNLTSNNDEEYRYKVSYDIKNSSGDSVYYFERIKDGIESNVIELTEPPIFDIFMLLNDGEYTIIITVIDLNANKTIKTESKVVKKI